MGFGGEDYMSQDDAVIEDEGSFWGNWGAMFFGVIAALIALIKWQLHGQPAVEALPWLFNPRTAVLLATVGFVCSLYSALRINWMDTRLAISSEFKVGFAMSALILIFMLLFVLPS